MDHLFDPSQIVDEVKVNKMHGTVKIRTRTQIVFKHIHKERVALSILPGIMCDPADKLGAS